MRIKSKFSPIVVIGFLTFSMSMAVSFNVHAAWVPTYCKQVSEVNRMIDDLMSRNKDLYSKTGWLGPSYYKAIRTQGQYMKEMVKRKDNGCHRVQEDGFGNIKPIQGGLLLSE
jgi:hypothetical protein